MSDSRHSTHAMPACARSRAAATASNGLGVVDDAPSLRRRSITSGAAVPYEWLVRSLLLAFLVAAAPGEMLIVLLFVAVAAVGAA